jgi:hypothetical protein
MAAKDAVSEFDDIFGQSALARSWPAPSQKASWPEALRLAGASTLVGQLEGCARTAHACIPMAGYPIVGVLGQLNAGKSSVVASFLSATGQARLPRGLHDGQGTHRFVYWLPEKWRDESTIWDAFRTLLDQVHGAQVEYLDDDPSHAAVQYGSGLGKPDIIRRPLIAFDPALNAQGFALLDCPDVQTRDEGTPQLTAKLNPRVEFACNAAKVCSAFLYVWEASKLNEALFTDLLQELRTRIPAVPMLLLVNKIKPFQGEPTRTRECRSLREAISTIGISSQAIYGAFDHDVTSRIDAKGEPQPGWADLTPPMLVQRHQDGGGNPQFFSLDTAHAENEPHAVDQSRFLHVTLKALPPAELQRTHVLAMIKALAHHSRDAVASLRAFVSERTNKAKTRQSHLLEVAVDVFTDRRTKQPTQLPDPQVLTALRDSITETAPWAIRALMNVRGWTELFVTRPLKATVKTLGETIQGVLTLPQQLGDKARETLDGFENLLIDRHSSRDLARALMAQRWFPTHINESQAIEAIDSAYRQVAKSATDNPCVPPKRELDKHARHMWSQTTTWEASRIFFTTLLGVLGDLIAIGGIALVVVDGGATWLGTVGIAKVISSQLVAIGILGGQTVALLNDLDSSLTRFNTIPSVSRLYAILCDVFGVPRPNNFSKLAVAFGPNKKRVKYHLVDPAIPVQPVVCPLGDQSLWQEEASVKRLESWVSTHE